MAKYESAFTMDNPPLLVAWLSFQFVERLNADAVSDLGIFLFETKGFSRQEKHNAPHVIWMESGPEVLKSLDLFATPDKRQLVGLSGREFYYVTAEYDQFQNTLDFVDSIVEKISPKGTGEILNLCLHFYNVFESEGLTTKLLLENVQGPPPDSKEAHEHRQFELTKILGGCWHAVVVEYLHGSKYKPEIRSGVESHLAFSPKFKPDRHTHCFKVDLSVVNPKKTQIADCVSALIDSRTAINDMFLSLVTKEAHAEWKITTT